MASDNSRNFEQYAATALLLLLVVGCYVILRPFVTAFLWGGIISISTRGLYLRVVSAFRGRHTLAASLTAFGLATVLLAPIAALGLKLAGQWPQFDDRITSLMSHGLGAPPSWLAGLPLVGSYASNYWHLTA